METVSAQQGVLARSVASRWDPQAIGVWVLGFALPVYLALEGGGYDTVVRGQIGIAIWWAIIVGCIAGVLPVSRPTRAAWATVVLLGGFAAWTLLSTSWSSSSERSLIEASRMAVHLGALVVAICVVRRDTARHVLNALGSAVGLVGVLALLSRLHPAWFPVNHLPDFLPLVASRLSYPLNYWNALGAMMAMGAPLLLYMATSARTVAGRSVAAAAFPLTIVTLYLTYSRGALLALVFALVVLVAIWPSRLVLLASGLVGGAGSLLLIASISQRHDLADGVISDLSARQGDQLLALSILTATGCGFLQAAITLVDRFGARPRFPHPSPRSFAIGVSVCAVAAVIVALGLGGPGKASDAWQRFKDPRAGLALNDANTAKRLTAASGKGRYQYWRSSVDAFDTRPLTGIGAGTFEYWWAEHGDIQGFVRNAHSLWFESLAEVGAVGLLLLVLIFAVPIGIGIARLREPAAERRKTAVALAASAAFLFSASFDWVWQMTVLPVMAMLLLAVLVRRGGEGARTRVRRPGWIVRGALVALAASALILIVIPLVGSTSVRASQQEAARDDLSGALARAEDAAVIQPYAATPELQQALLFEQAGSLSSAEAAARRATVAEARNWRTWLVLSRIQAERGEAAHSVESYRRARTLNPNSKIFRGKQ